MAQQTVLDKTVEKQYSLNYFLGIASSFKNPDNRKQTFDGYWTFDKIDAVLRLWVAPFNPELQKASFEEILEFLTQLAAEKQTETVVPAPLLEQLEEKMDQSEITAEEIRQKALDQAQKEIANIYRNRLKKELVKKLTTSQISEEKKTAVADSLSKFLSESLDESDLPVLSSKLEQTPQNPQLKKQVQQSFAKIWEETVAKTAEENNLSAEETIFLNSLASPVLHVVKPVENRTQISQFQKQLDDKNKPDEVLFFQEKIRNLKQQQEINLTKVLGCPLTPEKADFFVEVFLKTFPDNLVSLNTEEAVVATLWQMIGSEVRLNPEEIAAISAVLTSTDPSEIAVYQKLSSEPKQTINLMQLKTEEGITVFEQIKARLLSGGININPESDNQLKAFRFQIQAIEAIYKGLSENDLEIKINNLLKAGFTENSPEILELKGTSQALGEILQKAKEGGFSERQIQKWQSSAVSSSRLFLSRFGTIIDKISPLGKIKSSLFEKAKTWFLKTALGKPIRLALERSVFKGLQALWSAGQQGIRKAAMSILPKLFSFIGLGLKAAGVVATNILGILAVVGIKLLGKTKDLIKKIFSSTIGIAGRLLSGVTNTSEVPESENWKWLKWVLIGIFAFLVLGGVLKDATNKSALINEEGELGEPGFNIPGLPAQCQATRHYAEEVICVLKDCGIEKVTSANLQSTQNCIQQSSLEGKSILEKEMSRLYKDYLQCIGFVDAVQKALGYSMGERKNACQYLTNLPPGYSYISGKDSPQVGDVAIWNEEGCLGGKKSTAAYWGHSAIVIEVNGDRKITVAETNGLNGIMRILEYTYGHPENATDPTKFLRYNK